MSDTPIIPASDYEETEVTHADAADIPFPTGDGWILVETVEWDEDGAERFMSIFRRPKP